MCHPFESYLNAMNLKLFVFPTILNTSMNPGEVYEIEFMGNIIIHFLFKMNLTLLNFVVEIFLNSILNFLSVVDLH